MKLRSLIGLAAVLAVGMLMSGGGAAAGDPAVDCRHPGDTTYEMNVCAGRDFTAADTAMNALYKKLYAAYDADNKTRLQAAQRAWLKLRDSECDYETALTIGGTIHSTMVTHCNTELTLERVKRLKAQLTCEEGDMSCNHP
jgi:uncharacterized protein YecT (DUF1311 family)